MKHLSEEQFVEWASGERSEEASQHLRECSECLAEVQQLHTALEGFKGEIKEHAEGRTPFTGAQIRALAGAQTATSRAWWKLLPVPALAAVAVLAVMLSKPMEVKAPAPNTDDADNALLLAVSSDVYRAAPSALTPAASLNKERNQILTSSQRKK